MGIGVTGVTNSVKSGVLGIQFFSVFQIRCANFPSILEKNGKWGFGIRVPVFKIGFKLMLTDSK